METGVLFSPFSMKGLTLRNRFVMAPMTRGFADDDSVPPPSVASYYARRAAGGVGLIVSEGITVDHPSASYDRHVPALSTSGQVKGWRAVTDAVHAEGGLMAAQLWHVGRARTVKDAPFPEAPTLSAGAIRSRVPSPRGGPYARPRAMTLQEIEEVQDAFARSAKMAAEAGFDAVEIHGAHGYLVDQFLWEGTNDRTDGYGGSLEKRTRFAVEVVAAVRRAVGKDYPIIFRFSQWKPDDYDARPAKNPEELARILTPLKAAGVDAFHASQRDHAAPAFEDSPLNLAGWAKKLTGIPAISVGKVALSEDFLHSFQGREASLRPLDELFRQMTAGEFDLIAVGRALLADPDLVNKIREDRFETIVPFAREMLSRLD